MSLKKEIERVVSEIIKMLRDENIKFEIRDGVIGQCITGPGFGFSKNWISTNDRWKLTEPRLPLTLMQKIRINLALRTALVNAECRKVKQEIDGFYKEYLR